MFSSQLGKQIWTGLLAPTFARGRILESEQVWTFMTFLSQRTGMLVCWNDAGTPEAIGKAELLDTIARGMNRWQGFSIGLSKQLSWLDGTLHKRQAAIHQVMENAEAGELNFILAHNNCANLLEVAAEETIDLLTSSSRRLRDLNTLSR